MGRSDFQGPKRSYQESTGAEHLRIHFQLSVLFHLFTGQFVCGYSHVEATSREQSPSHHFITPRPLEFIHFIQRHNRHHLLHLANGIAVLHLRVHHRIILRRFLFQFTPFPYRSLRRHYKSSVASS